MRRALPIALAVLAIAPTACGGDDGEEPKRVQGDTLTVYASLPAHGVEAEAGDAAEAGMRRALRAAGGAVDGRRVKLVRLSSTRPGDAQWDPGTVEANAERAADDPTTIAYLGELDQGASAVSLPVTNRESILQVSPADGLTSFTRTPPGRPRAGPERYYPGELRSFVRLVRPDLDAAREIVRSLRARGARRLAVLHGDGIADRELEAMVLATIGEGLPEVVVRTDVGDGEPDDVANRVEDVVAAQPDAVLYAAPEGVATARLLPALARRLPDVPIYGGPPLAHAEELPPGVCALTGVPRGGRLSEQRLGYEAMRLTLDAIADGGPSRPAVVRAAHEPGVRRGAIGRYEITPRGDVTGRPPVRCG